MWGLRKTRFLTLFLIALLAVHMVHTRPKSAQRHHQHNQAEVFANAADAGSLPVQQLQFALASATYVAPLPLLSRSRSFSESPIRIQSAAFSLLRSRAPPAGC